MLICHCNLITEKEIEDTIVELLGEDTWQLIVPAKVYHRLGKRGRCCGCFPDVVETIIRVTEAYHAAATASARTRPAQRRLHGRGRTGMTPCGA